MLKIETENDEVNYIYDVRIDYINYFTEMTNTKKEICIIHFLLKKAEYYLTSSIIDLTIHADYKIKDLLPNSIRNLYIKNDNQILIKYIKIPYKTTKLNLIGGIKKITISKRCLLKYNENYYGKIKYKII